MPDFFAAYFGSDNALTAILWPLFLGVLLGIIISICQNKVIGTFLHRLFLGNIDSPESAQTLTALGYRKAPLLRFALRRGTTLRKLVLLVPASETEAVTKALTESEPQIATKTALPQECAKVAQDNVAYKAAETEDGAKRSGDTAEVSFDMGDFTEATDADAHTDEVDASQEPDPALVANEENRMRSADFEHDKWYLNPATRERAESLCKKQKTSLLLSIVSIFAFLGLVLVAFFLIPFISDLASSIF